MAALSVDGTPMPALPNSADQINYDNTTSGLSATTVKGAVDELASEKQDKSDNSLQTTDKTVVGSINELKSGLTNVDVALSVPDGSGKNVLPYTLTSIKQNNSSGTWVDNTVTINGVNFTITASGNRVTKISATRVSASESNAILELVDYAAKTGEILSGCPSGGSNTAYKVYCRGGGTNDFGEGETIAAGDVGVSRRYSIAVFSTSSPTNLEFYPMIRPATITDPTFAPYIPSVESRIEAVESGLTNLGTSANMSNWNDYADFKGKYVIIGKLCIFNLSVTKGDASWNLAGIPNQQAAIDNTAVAYDAVNQKRIFAKNTTGAIVLQLQVTDTYTNATNVSGCIVLA